MYVEIEVQSTTSHPSFDPRIVISPFTVHRLCSNRDWTHVESRHRKKKGLDFDWGRLQGVGWGGGLLGGGRVGRGSVSPSTLLTS